MQIDCPPWVPEDQRQALFEHVREWIISGRARPMVLSDDIRVRILDPGPLPSCDAATVAVAIDALLDSGVDVAPLIHWLRYVATLCEERERDRHREH